MPALFSSLESPMLDLQNRWYNTLTAQLQLDPWNFQINQPAPPIGATDQSLWSYQNAIPTASLTFNRNLSVDSFFSPYAAVVQQLVCPTQLIDAVGPIIYGDWMEYLDGLRTQPPPSQLPTIFRDWATANNHRAVAQRGASALISINIFNGQKNALQPYQGPDAKPIDFQGTFSGLINTLAATGSRSLSMDSRETSANVEQTWTGGLNLGLQGLWTGSSPDTGLSRTFAGSNVTVAVTLTHFTQWMSTPGDWYSSSLLNVAYNSTATPPWPQDAAPTWDDAFGVNGTLLYFIASLLAGDGLTAEITSDAAYSEIDQRAIEDHAAEGLWPFYAATGDRTVTNTVSFDPNSKNMTVQTAAKAGNPFVLGANVLSISRYLGG